MKDQTHTGLEEFKLQVNMAKDGREVGLAGQKSEFIRRVSDVYGFSEERCKGMVKKMEGLLPEDWFDRWKNDDATIWAPVVSHLLNDGGELWPGRMSVDQRRGMLINLSWVVAANGVKKNQISGQSENGTLSNNSNENYTFKDADLTVVKHLEPLLKYSSGGDDCVPTVALWMLALATGETDAKRLEEMRSAMKRDVTEIRQSKNKLAPQGNWLDESYIRYVLEGRLGDSGKPKTFALTYDSINGGRWDEPAVDKVEKIFRSVNGKGSFTAKGVNESEVEIRGMPVIGVNLLTSLNTWVGAVSADTVEVGSTESARGVRELGSAFDLASMHYALLIDIGGLMVAFLDPQTGMIVGTRRDEFNKQVKKGNVQFGMGLDVSHLK